jgi:hypothetical protein
LVSYLIVISNGLRLDRAIRLDKIAVVLRGRDGDSLPTNCEMQKRN